MDTTVEAPVRRQVQSTNFYCGAACAVMLLSRKDQMLTQDAAYSLIRAGNTESSSFYTDPDGLEACLDGILSQIQFDDLSGEDKKIILQACLSVLTEDQRPVPILVKQGNHWVLIDGMIIEAMPNGVSKIKTVVVVDPWPEAPERSFIAVDVFQDEYLTSVKYGSKWKGKLVVVKQKDRPAGAEILTAEQTIMGGGGEVGDALIIKNLQAIGIAAIDTVIGGGLAFSTVRVHDLINETEYTISALDGSRNDKFSDFILVAADTDGKILEAAKFSPRFNYFSDSEARALAVAQVSGEVSVDPDYFFFESRQLRSRFLVARRLLVDDVEHWLMPDGVLMAHRDEPKEGGQ
jgi:hypothetical protein